MTPNEYAILRFMGPDGCATARQIARHMNNPVGYTMHLCAAMVSHGLLTEYFDDTGMRRRRAYRLTQKSQNVLTEMWRGMEDNLRRRAARFRRVAGIIEERADRLGEKAMTFQASGETEGATAKESRTSKQLSNG